jgi:hypothetical protein
MAERLKILLSGMVAADPHQGGATWAVLQYVAGLTALGHEVLLVEPVARADDLAADGEVGRYFRGLPFLDGRAALLLRESERTLGLSFEEIAKFAAEADLLLNVSGMLDDERLLAPIPVRAFLDLDPGFNQVWHETGHDMNLDRHTHFVTVGQCVGSERSAVPDCGRRWLTSLPPVALEHWPAAPASAVGYGFTTVGHWRSYGSLEHAGIHYGQRAHSFRELIDLPRRTEARFQVALGIHPDESRDLRALAHGGWELLDPRRVAGTPAAYQQFIRGSLGELCVAKSGYVRSRSGWISDRSACYLASGRPVLAQDTGIGALFPDGRGLIAYGTEAEAAVAAEEVRDSWALHSAAARELAEERFDARKVLSSLLERLASRGGAGGIS